METATALVSDGRQSDRQPLMYRQPYLQKPLVIMRTCHFFSFWPWHILYLRPEPQGQGALRGVPGKVRPSDQGE